MRPVDAAVWRAVSGIFCDARFLRDQIERYEDQLRAAEAPADTAELERQFRRAQAKDKLNQP